MCNTNSPHSLKFRPHTPARLEDTKPEPSLPLCCLLDQNVGGHSDLSFGHPWTVEKFGRRFISQFLTQSSRTPHRPDLGPTGLCNGHGHCLMEMSIFWNVPLDDIWFLEGG